jgi:hypothetical protein
MAKARNAFLATSAFPVWIEWTTSWKFTTRAVLSGKTSTGSWIGHTRRRRLLIGQFQSADLFLNHPQMYF